MKKNTTLLLIVLCLFMAPLLRAQQQPQLHEEVTVRWWLVPVYAIDKAGAPVLNLAPEDLDVRIKGIKVEQFSLIKKQFEVAGAKKMPAAPAAQAQKKMVFLVFDAAFTPFSLLEHTKAVAETVIAQSDKSAQYVLLSIEPYIGLKYIFGPSRDREQLSKKLNKYVEGKKPDYSMEAGAMDRGEINNAYPEGDTRNPVSSAAEAPGSACPQRPERQKGRLSRFRHKRPGARGLILHIFADDARPDPRLFPGIQQGRLFLFQRGPPSQRIAGA